MARDGLPPRHRRCWRTTASRTTSSSTNASSPRPSTSCARFPEQRFVIDHIAKPDIRGGSLKNWRAAIEAIAREPNAWCKLSGMVTEADWSAWTPTTFTPYLDVVIEAFGPERCMIGSDWPVCTLAGDYATVMTIVIDYAQRLSPSERDALLGGTATAFYRL